MNTSFGPFGRSKLVHNLTGGTIITKDGEQLLKYTNLVNQYNYYHKYAINQCMKCGEHVGDGLLSQAIVLNSLFSGINQQERCSTFHPTIVDQRQRVCMLKSAEAVLHVMHTLRNHISQYLIKVGAWHEENDISIWITNICRNVLIPAASDIDSALGIVDVVSTILLSTPAGIAMQSLQTGRLTLSSLGDRCRYTLAHFDSLVFSTLDGSGSNAHSASRTGTIKSGMCVVIPHNELVLLGRCKDFHQLCGRQEGSDGSHRQPTSAQSTAPSSGYRFVCIRHLLSQSTAVTEEDRSVADNYVVEIKSADPSAERTNHMRRPGLDLIQSAAAYLRMSQVDVVFCSDRVDDEALFIAANSGIYVVDSLSGFYLDYLAARTSSPVFDTPAEFIDHALTTAAADTYGELQYGRAKYATFERLKRLKFNSSAYNGSSNSFYHICGLSAEGNISASAAAVTEIGQLILRHTSVTQSGTCNRLVKRCLKSILFSCDQSAERSEVEKVGSAEATELLPCTAGESSRPVVVPGGGAAELGWALLWDLVASDLATSAGDSIFSERNGSIEVAGAGPPQPSPAPHQHRLSPLARTLSEALATRLTVGLEREDMRRAVFTHCVRFCRGLAVAYREVSRSLLRSCADVLDFDYPTAEPTNADHTMDKFSSAHSTSSIDVSTMRRNVTPFDKAWCTWMRLQRQGLQQEGVQQEGVQQSGLRVGIVANMDDPLSLEICSLRDSIDSGVYFSREQFWTGFVTVLELARVSLRLSSSQEDVLYVQRLKCSTL